MAFHVYGVVSAATTLQKVLRGRGEARVRLVVYGDLAAVVSEVDSDARVRRDDLLAHARVLEAIIEDSTVLPMRFGVIVDDYDEVADVIVSAGEGRLTALLESFDGLVQLTVKAYHDQDQALRHLLRERPELRELRDQTAAAPSSYHSKIRLGEAIAANLEALASADASMLHDQLSGLAERIVLNEASGGHKILDAALLVRRDTRAQTDEGIAQIRHPLPDRLTLRYVGPLPPYSFVDGHLAGEPAWG